MGQRERQAARGRVDPRWARVALEQLRDDEFLSKQLRRQETLAGARRAAQRRQRGHAARRAVGVFAEGARGGGDRALWTKLLKRRGPTATSDEADDGDHGDDADEDDETARRRREDELLHALVLLGDLPQPTRAAYLLCHLQDQLARDCEVPDPVAQVVALRREILRDVYDAVAVQHAHFRAAAAAFEATVELLKARGAGQDAPVDDDTRPPVMMLAGSPSGVDLSSAETSFATEFTVELLGGLLEAATSEGGTAAPPRRELFHEMVRLIELLPPASLLPVQPRGAASSLPASSDVKGLVQKLQRFLLGIITGKACTGCGGREGMSSRGYSIAQVEFDMADRTSAVNCLIRLAAANGSVRDFLVIVSVLLGLGDGTEFSDSTTGLTDYPVQAASSPRALRLAHGSTSPVAITARSPTREQIHLKEYDNDHLIVDERGDVADEIANFAVEQRLKQVHKQRGDQGLRDFDGQTTAVDQLLSSHSKRKTGPKSVVVAHTKAAISNVVVAGTSPTMVNLPAHRVSVPHPPSLASKLHAKAAKDDLNNLSLEADLTYSLDVTSSRSDIPSPPSPRHGVSSAANVVCPKFFPLDVGGILKMIDQIKPTAATRQHTTRTLGSPNHHAAAPLLHHDTESSDDDHEVWSCGQNSYGELGHGDANTRKSFERIEALQQKDIVQVSAGNEHTVALSADGTVWTCGYNDNGQCGHGITTRINHLTEVQKLGDSPVTQVHAYNGCEHTILVMQDGRAASCGYNYRGQLGHGNTQSESVPKIMRSIEGKQVRLVSCSYYHTAITCDNGPGGRSLVYTFGRNDYGQLGQGDTIDRKVPQSVEYMHDQHVVSIACGQYHTMAVTSSGKLFAFGKNDYGQLGVDTVENQLSPVHVKHGLERQNCTEVRCGYYHSIVLCAGAHLFGFGRNDYGQLGIGKANNAPSVNMQLQQQRFARPQLVEDLEGKEIVRFACGCYHTVAVSDNGVLYVFGRNNHGQLGTGDTNERLYPHPIDEFIGKRVALVAAGFYHTLVLTGGKDEDVEEEQDLGVVASANRESSTAPDSEEVDRLEPTSLSFSSILSSPFAKELFEAKVPRACLHQATGMASVQQTASTPHSRDVKDPSSDADADDGRTEDRYGVDSVDSESISATDRLVPRHIDGENGSVLGGSPGRLSHSVGDSLDVIVVICAQLDRLCSPFLVKKGATFPPIQQLPTAVTEMLLKQDSCSLSELVDGVFEKYSIQVQGSTLLTLSSLILHLNSRRFDALNSSIISAYLSPRVSLGAGKLQAYLLSVCFRILQANLVQAIKSGLGNLIVAVQHAEVVVQAGYSEQVSSAEVMSELCSLRDSVRHVRAVLLGLIIKPKQPHKNCATGAIDADINPSGGIDRVVTDAIDSLMLGFDVFFPCPCSRVALFMNLMSAVSKDDEATCCVCHSIELSRLRHLKANVKRQLLMAMLKRSAEDATVVKFLFYLCPSQQVTKRGVEPIQSLDTIACVLLDHLNNQFIHTLGEITATSMLCEDEPPAVLVNVRHDHPVNDSIVTLLNAIHKHVASLVRTCDTWTRKVAPDEKLSLAARLALVVSSAMHVGTSSCERTDDKTAADFPMAWRGLLQLALRLLGQSSDILAQVLSRNQPSPSSLGYTKSIRKDLFADSEFCERLGKALERSVVGRVLPLLVNCLLEFSHIPAFAVSLISPLQSVMKLLDEWNSTNKSVKYSADDDIKNQLGKSLVCSAPSTNTAKQRPGGSTVRRQSANTTSQLAVGQGSVTSRVPVSEALDAPWSLLLEKELAIVCAEMAVAITLGSPLVHISFGEDGADSKQAPVDPLLTKWQRSALFEGGISAEFVHTSVVGDLPYVRTAPYSPISLFRQSSTTAPTFLLTLPQREGDYCDEYDGVTSTSHPDQAVRQLARRSCVRAFIAEMAHTSESCHGELRSAAQSLCEWLRARHAKNDAAYRMLLRQSQLQKPPVPETSSVGTSAWSDAQLEEGFFAALLHHHSLEAFAVLVGMGRCRAEFGVNTPLPERAPPASLLALWHVVADFRRRFVAKRTTIKNSMGADEAQYAINRLRRSTSDRTQLLLLMEIEEEEEHRSCLLDGGFVAPWDPAFIFRACTTTAASVVTSKCPRSHMNARYGNNYLPFLTEYPTSRWRRVRVLFHVVGRWKAAVLASSALGSTKLISAALDFVTADEAEVGDIHEFSYGLLVDPCRQMSCSTRGYELLWDLMCLPRLESVRTCLVQHICLASTKLTTDQAEPLGVTAKGNAGFVFREMCRNAQNDFLTAVVQFMVDKASEMGPLSSAELKEQTSQRVLLILMRCLSLIHVSTGQYEFINDLGLVQVLQQMADSHTDDEVEAENVRAMALRSSAGSVDCRRDELQIKAVAWALIRNIILHLGASSSTSGTAQTRAHIPVYPACADAFETLHADARRLLQHLSRSGKSQCSLIQRARNAGGSINSTIRRSFEIIVSPMRLSYLTKGVTFTYSSMIDAASGMFAMSPLVKPSEFSITTWVFAASSPATQIQPAGDPTISTSEEKQIVFVRGDEREISPYVLLQRDIESNWQIEVGVAVHVSHPNSVTPMRLLWERLNSKESITPGGWTHVAVVLEGAKMRLYLNGILDSQRSLSGPLASAINSGNVDLDFCFGRQQPIAATDVSTSLETTDAQPRQPFRAAKAMAFLSALVAASAATSKSLLATSPSNSKPLVRSFNGLLSHFRFHNRSLSPIHVRIVYDEKKPVKEDEASPRSFESNMADDATKILQLHSLLRVMVESDEGRVHLADSSWSVQLWEIFMQSRLESTQLSSLRLLRLVMLSQNPLVIDEIISRKHSKPTHSYCFVRHVLQIIGACVSPARDLLPFAVPRTLMKHRNNEGIYDDCAMELRNSTAKRLLQECSRGTISIALACELRGLLVELLNSKDNESWPLRIWNSWRNALQDNPANTIEDDLDAWYAKVGCLYVLGGSAQALTSGADVELTGTSDHATVISVEEPSSLVFPKPKVIEGTNKSRQTSTVYLSIHENNNLRTAAYRGPWHELVQEACVSFNRQLRRSKLTHHSTQTTDHSDDVADVVSFVRVHRDDVVITKPPNLLFVGASETLVSDVVSRLSQAATTLTSEFRFVAPCGISELERWLSSGLLIQSISRAASTDSIAPHLLGDERLMFRLLEMSTTVDSNEHYAPLEEVERKLWIVRARVYQVLHDLEEQGELEVRQWLELKRATKADNESPAILDTKGSEKLCEDGKDAEQSGSSPPVGGKLDLRLDLAVDDPENDEDNSVGRRSSSCSNESNTENAADSSKIDLAAEGDPPDSAGDDDEDEDDDDEDEDDAEEEEEDEEAAEHRQEFVDELMMMGFPEEWCVLALKQTENDIVSASAWIVDNLEYLSRLQTTLDKQRDQSTDKLVFEDEDDDEGDEVFGAADETSVDLDASAKPEGGPQHYRAPSRQGSGARTHPHSPVRPDGTHHLINDKEMGRKIFGEMYFPFEDGGYNSTGKEHFFTSWRTESTKGGALSAPTSTSPDNLEEGHETVQATENSERADKTDQFIVTVDSLELNELLDHLAELERTFLIVSSRQVISTLLNRHEHHGDSVVELCKSPLFLQFLKLVLCRGQQFQVCQSGVGNDDPLEDVEAILRGCLCRMLRSGTDDPAFAQRLLDFALDQVEAASSTPAFEAVLWTQRELRRSDRVVSEEPALELAAWLFDLVLDLESECFQISAELVVNAINRLRSALRSTNLPVKFIAITTMSRALQLIRQLQWRASEVSLQTILEDCRLDVESFLCAARNRFMREQVQHRAIFSLYLQAYVEILHLLQQVSDTKSLQGPATMLPPPIPPSCLATTSPLLPDPTKAIVNHPTLGFDRIKCRSSLLQISDDGLTATYSGNELWKTVVASHSFATGVHEWHIRIEKSSSSYLFIGVATRKVNMDSFLGADDHSWGFIGDKALYYQRNRLRVYGDNFGEGDVVGVHLNCELGTLGFSKNGVFLGIAFENLLDEVFPAVAFYSRHQKVSIVPSDVSHASSDHDYPSNSHSSLPSDGTVEEAVMVCDMMDSMVTKSPLPQQLIRPAYDMTLAWWNGTGRHIVTRSGSTLWVDVTKAACGRFGFSAGEQVRSPRGNGHVVGVADGRLWIEVAGEAGAWHIHPSRLRTMTLSVSSIPTTDAEKSSSSEHASSGFAIDDAQARTGRDLLVGSSTDSDTLTQAEFATFVQDRVWSLQLDRAVLHVIDSHCESTSTSPWNISPTEIVRIVRSKAHEIELATGVMLNFDGNDGGRRLERKVIARYGFLRFFNAYFSRVTGFFDLTWHYFTPKSGLLPCRLLSQCRGSVFTSIKNEFFTALLDKTSNSPKKSDDDYDYPDDLTQMLINRPKAATAKCHPGTTTSLMLSMFGQAFDELHFLPLRMLRMVYSHPMDDGQLRSFKVKFEGEGVDDYGGPYREFFSQFFAELQMMCSDDDGGAVSGGVVPREVDAEKSSKLGTSFLPFLMPSPNWRNGVGSSRERFILNGSLLGSRRVGSARVVSSSSAPPTKRGWAENPEVKRQLQSEMCHFLGQMIGIALRTRVCVRLDLAASVWKQLVGEDQDRDSVLADLKETDFAAHSLLKTLTKLHEAFTNPKTDGSRRLEIEEEVAAMDLTFTTYLSDGRLVELCENGCERTVTMSNVAHYLDLVIHARMDESYDVVNVIKQGIHSIIPVAALSMLTWEELEKRICGVAEVDVELLKRNTEYDEDLSAQDEFIQRFWRVLAEMDDEDKRAFLRFVWARSRLPVGMAQFHQKFKIQSLASTASGSDGNNGSSSTTASSTASGYADGQLPKSHTCFFALQLPRYSTDEVCRKQLLYAIHNCVEMDGDFRLADAEMTGWTDVNPNDQLRF